MIDKEPELIYALNTNGRMVHVDSVPNGTDCGCVCPKCHQPLIAKQGEKRLHHFAHCGEYGEHGAHPCRGYFEAEIHCLAKQIIKDKKELMLPAFEDFVKAKRVRFVKVEVEERNDRKDLQPDVVGETEDGRRIMIEIYYSHQVREDKKNKIKELGCECVEIDVKGVEENTLENFLLNESIQREWLVHPLVDKIKNDRYKSAIQNTEEKEKEYKKLEIQRAARNKEIIDIKRKRHSEKERKQIIQNARYYNPSSYDDVPDIPYNYYYNYHLEDNIFCTINDIHKKLTDILRDNKLFIKVGMHETKIYRIERGTDCLYILHANVGCQGRNPIHLTRMTIRSGQDFYQNLGAYDSEDKALWACRDATQRY